MISPLGPSRFDEHKGSACPLVSCLLPCIMFVRTSNLRTQTFRLLTAQILPLDIKRPILISHTPSIVRHGLRILQLGLFLDQREVFHDSPMRHLCWKHAKVCRTPAWSVLELELTSSSSCPACGDRKILYFPCPHRTMLGQACPEGGSSHKSSKRGSSSRSHGTRTAYENSNTA